MTLSKRLYGPGSKDLRTNDLRSSVLRGASSIFMIRNEIQGDDVNGRKSKVVYEPYRRVVLQTL